MSISEIRLRANAKINLTLDIVGRREDGYHLLDMVNRSVNLCDDVIISRVKSGGLAVRSNVRFLPQDERNLAYKAAVALCRMAGAEIPDLNIFIRKRIPTQAGLGGGSADAAAVLVGLNRLLEFGYSAEQLCKIGETIGADVPFCIVGGTARVGGIGEIIQPVADCCDYSLVILMPAAGRSTREAYAAIDAGSGFQRPNTDGMLRALASGDDAGMAILLCNAFATGASDETTARLISQLLSRGALGASLSGTGAAVFGIFANNLTARRACGFLRGRGVQAFAACPAASGVEII